MNKLLSINLPNGFLIEQQSDTLTAAHPEAVLLSGELFCMVCFVHYGVGVLIAQRLCRPTDPTTIVCPHCNAKIVELGTDHARVALKRIGDTILPEGTKRAITPPKKKKKK